MDVQLQHLEKRGKRHLVMQKPDPARIWVVKAGRMK